MWNPTIPQDKKFSTIITKLLGPCSSQSHRGADNSLSEDPAAEIRIQLYSTAGDVTSLDDWRDRDIHLLDIIR